MSVQIATDASPNTVGNSLLVDRSWRPGLDLDAQGEQKRGYALQTGKVLFRLHCRAGHGTGLRGNTGGVRLASGWSKTTTSARDPSVRLRD